MPECTCQQRYEDALARGDDGLAAFIETKCELSQGPEHGAGVTETGEGSTQGPGVAPSATGDARGARNDNHVILEGEA